ncbi:ABC transporter permease [[Mycobacterium] fortunisiensis]|uniref:ABC transporter permease n=1 Tax=[Mycobacterium] fortunisiensis TaxID=2600579 RepID=UPI0027E10C84|nr:ABC transporter permease [[Mycobacterium] fortunisiensis]
MTSHAELRSSYVAESLLFCNQLLTHWRRGPAVTIQAVFLPTFLLIMYQLLVGESILRITGADSIYGLVPTCAVAGAMFGALAAGMTIPVERDSGLLSQMWLLPVRRGSALTGRLLAEAVRTVVATALITAVGIGMGLRFEGNLLALIAFLLVPSVVVVIFSMAIVAIATRSKRGTVLVWFVVPAISLVFASSGAPPIEMLPTWMQPLVRLQPMSATISAMRALAEGGPVLEAVLVGTLWAVGLVAVVAPLAISGYRAAAESGR